MLSGALKQKSAVVYVAIIILSTDITLAFVLNNFIFRKTDGFNYLYSLFSIIIILAIGFSINQFFNKYNAEFDRISMTADRKEPLEQDGGHAEKGKHFATEEIKGVRSETGMDAESQEIEDTSISKPNTDNEKREEIAIQTESIDAQTENSYTRTDASFDILCDDSNTLLVELKKYSEALFEHSKRIADLSFRAALEIGADAKLALAGGLYHEIGRIKGGANYIEDGLAIADEYKFPASLKAIIREHNNKYGKPSSLEACLVMLSDSVESSISYVKKNEGNKFTADKIIENVFRLRMDKGTFDACPLKIRDYKKLKEFYINEYSNDLS